MKRYQKKLDAGVPPAELPNYSPRVDCCLKRGPKRQRCTQDRSILDDADDNDGGECIDSSSRPGGRTSQPSQGYRQKAMTLRPNVIYTGRRFLQLKSMHQLLPAPPFREHSEDEEDEETNDNDKGQYRLTTLKNGRKTIQQKEEEKRKQEAAENQRLFGDPEEDPGCKGSQTKHKGPSIYKKVQRPFNTPQKVITRRQLAKESCIQNTQLLLNRDTYRKQFLEDTSDNINAHDQQAENLDEDDEEAENSVDSSCFASTIQSNADNELPVIDSTGSDLRNTDSGNTEKAQKSFKQSSRMSLWNNEDKQAISQPLLEMKKETKSSNLNIEALEEDLAPPPIKVSRVCKKPKRDLKPPAVSFIDRSYFQKFQLCCVPVYIGEGDLFIMDCSRFMPNCPKMLIHLQKHQAKIQERAAISCSTAPQVSETMLRGELASSSPASTCSSDISDGRSRLIPSPTESTCATFQFCTMVHNSQDACC